MTKDMRRQPRALACDAGLGAPFDEPPVASLAQRPGALSGNVFEAMPLPPSLALELIGEALALALRCRDRDLSLPPAKVVAISGVPLAVSLDRISHDVYPCAYRKVHPHRQSERPRNRAC